MLLQPAGGTAFIFLTKYVKHFHILTYQAIFVTAFQFFKECRAFASTFINISKKGCQRCRGQIYVQKSTKLLQKKLQPTAEGVII